MIYRPKMVSTVLKGKDVVKTKYQTNVVVKKWGFSIVVEEKKAHTFYGNEIG